MLNQITAMCELNKNKVNGSVKGDWENHLSPQKYIKNYWKLRNSQSRRGALLLKAHKLVFLCQIV